MTIDSLRNVSGTAFWIAHSRAIETQRKNPLFRDPWAARLAADRGREVMEQLPGTKQHTWVMTVRTLLLDRMIVDAVTQHGCDTVINLGAGLDTRAFRLALPHALRWWDVDSSEIIAHKRDVLGDAEPSCVWNTLTADLSVDGVRQQTLKEVTANAKNALVLTEGLLEYLTPEAVRGLARELHAEPAVQTWLLNLYAKGLADRTKRVHAALAERDIRFQFAPETGTAFFRDVGWEEAEWASILTTGIQLRRVPALYRVGARLLLRFGPARIREQLPRILGVARLRRAER
jgi:methyltransferase (TIGR00027 family)